MASPLPPSTQHLPAADGLYVLWKVTSSNSRRMSAWPRRATTTPYLPVSSAAVAPVLAAPLRTAATGFHTACAAACAPCAVVSVSCSGVGPGTTKTVYMECTSLHQLPLSTTRSPRSKYWP